jgi:hypothetical protein
VLVASEARTLAFWRSTGAAIELLERDDDGFTLLLERARPGTPLLQSGLSWDEMLVDLGRLARRLNLARSQFARAWAPPQNARQMRDARRTLRRSRQKATATAPPGDSECGLGDRAAAQEGTRG